MFVVLTELEGLKLSDCSEHDPWTAALRPAPPSSKASLTPRRCVDLQIDELRTDGKTDQSRAQHTHTHTTTQPSQSVKFAANLKLFGLSDDRST